jgi:putative ABC transport system permease protein
VLRVSLKSLLAHKIRFTLTTLSVVVGVAFVVGAFVLTDTVRGQFDRLFEDITAGIALTVRGEEQFDQGPFGSGTAAPLPESLVPEIQAVDGVDVVAGTITGFPALVIDGEGEPLRPSGGPPLGVNAIDSDLLGSLIPVEGVPPESDDQVAIDEQTADRGDLSPGDSVTVSTPLGPVVYDLSGTFTFGESNALAGATLVAFTTPEAQRLFNLPGQFQTIEVAIAPGADPAAVMAEIAPLLPERTEVVDNAVVVEESQQDVGSLVTTFGNVLLGFAGVTLFVSAFLINNTFTIVVGQRIRELALLRAVGASERQVASSVLVEALAVGLVASVIGFGLGLLTAMGLNAILSTVGFGAEGAGLVISPRAIVAALFVGLLVTFLAALLPAWRATTVPPVAAMRDGFTFRSASLGTRSAVGGTMAVIGAALLGYALFGRPETIGLVGGMIGGALLIFLGVAALSPLFARPVARGIGAPFGRLWKETGKLSRENAARSPRRTSSTASALMIGLALVSMALIVGNSVKSTFADTLGTAITADWYLDTGSFFPFSPEVTRAMEELPELDAVTPGRFGAMQIDDSTKQFSAVEFATIDDLFNLDITDGSIEPGDHGVAVQSDPAADLDLSVGDTIEATFNQTGVIELPVVAIYDNSSVLGNWTIDLETYNENFTEDLDFWAAARTAPGVDPEDARAAIEQVAEPYPEVRVQDREEFQADQESQLDQLLLIVNVFLLLAIVIAFIGIVNTLALSVFERTRELGLLRAVGMTNRQVRRMIRLEAVIVAVFGALLGVAVGLVFGLAVTTALPDDFVSTIDIPVGSLVVLVVVAALLGVVAAIWPAIRATRLDVLKAISFE